MQSRWSRTAHPPYLLSSLSEFSGDRSLETGEVQENADKKTEGVKEEINIQRCAMYRNLIS